MNVEELRRYNNWVGQSALTIYNSARSVGGWQAVFPGKLARWASKVRNYFNIVPKELTQAEEKEAKAFLKFCTLGEQLS